MDKTIIEYAKAITSLAMVAEYTPEVVFNGVAIAAVAMLLDAAIKVDGGINEENLEDATEYFQDALLNAMTYAKEQISLAQKLSKE